MARVVLIGLPGVGKSTVGEHVANQLGVPFVDLDDLIAETVGTSAGEYLRLHGESGFRRVELSQLETVLARDVVLATGGGVVTTAAARDLLREEGHVVWLQATVDTLVERVGSSDRPLLEGDARARLERLEQERTAFYRELARAKVDASQPLEDVVRDVVACVGI